MTVPEPHMDTPAADPPPSRRRIWTTLLAAALAGTVYASLHYCGTPADQPAPPTAATPSPAPPAAPAPHGHMGTDSEPGTSASNDQAISAIRGFATDFAVPGTGPEDWWTRARRWASPHLADALRSTDWNRLPAATLTTVRIHASGPSVADAEAVYANGLALAIRAEKVAQEWRVTTVVPMRTRY
ncbi:hypothetical protein [Nocardia sp. IFM 10818]